MNNFHGVCFKRWGKRLGFASISILFYAGAVFAQNSPVDVARTICSSQVERGESFGVTVSIIAHQSIAGLALDEDMVGYPGDWSPWEVSFVENDGAATSSTVEWLWLSVTEQETRQITYRVIALATIPTGTYAISGSCSSKLPSFEQPVNGDWYVSVQDTQPPLSVTGFEISRGSEHGEIDLSWDR